MNTKKEIIINYLDTAKESQVNMIYDLLNMGEMPNKHDLVKFSQTNIDNYDTATPIDYFRRIEEIYPNFGEGCYIYDYTNNKFGGFVNINNLVVNRILKSLLP